MASSVTCSSCGASILWTKTDANGKAMPVDPTPTDRGNLALYYPDRGTGPVIAKAYGEDERRAGAPRYTSHFATCPSAAHHRRARA